MKITGENGIGKILKFFLQIGFYVGIVFLIILPFILNKMGFNLKSCMFVLYPNGILLLLMIHKCIELFNYLKIYIFNFIYEIIFMKSTDTIFYGILVFLCALFLGISIALFILSELFRQATEYKKENDLTI